MISLNFLDIPMITFLGERFPGVISVEPELAVLPTRANNVAYHLVRDKNEYLLQNVLLVQDISDKLTGEVIEYSNLNDAEAMRDTFTEALSNMLFYQNKVLVKEVKKEHIFRLISVSLFFLPSPLRVRLEYLKERDLGKMVEKIIKEIDFYTKVFARLRKMTEERHLASFDRE